MSREPLPGHTEMIAVAAENHQQVEQQLLAVLMHDRSAVVYKAKQLIRQRMLNTGCLPIF
jgi:hypothetical protein